MASIDAQLFELARLFGEVAAEPIPAILLAIGALITLFYATVAGWLSLGAVGDFFTRA